MAGSPKPEVPAKSHIDSELFEHGVDLHKHRKRKFPSDEEEEGGGPSKTIEFLAEALQGSSRYIQG